MGNLSPRNLEFPSGLRAIWDNFAETWGRLLFSQSAQVRQNLRGELPLGLAWQTVFGDIKTASLGFVMVKTTPRRAVKIVFQATVAVVERRDSGKCPARGCGKNLGSCARTVARRKISRFRDPVLHNKQATTSRGPFSKSLDFSGCPAAGDAKRPSRPTLGTFSRRGN